MIREDKQPDKAPFLVGVKDAADLLGISATLFRQLDGSGGVPQAIRLHSRKLWRYDELRQWVAAGCPSRQRWKYKAL